MRCPCIIPRGRAALSDLGTRSGGEEGRKLLGEAVAAHRSALEVYTKADRQHECAIKVKPVARRKLYEPRP